MTQDAERTVERGSIPVAPGSRMETDEASLSIRLRDERDIQEIVGWVPDATALYLFTGPRLRWPLTASQLQGMLTIEGLTPSVAVTSSGELVGHFDLTVAGAVARLGRVIVNPALRGRGFGGVIVDFAVAEAQRLGADVLRLTVISTNEPAVRAYRRAGFTPVAGDSERRDVTVMERSVTSSL